jgi:hypothetical protein
MFGVCEVRDRTVRSVVDKCASWGGSNTWWGNHQTCYMVLVYTCKLDAALALKELDNAYDYKFGPTHFQVSFFSTLPPIQYRSNISI